MSQSYAFITGGLGFIGSFITRQLIEQNIVDKVVCLDHFGRYVTEVHPSAPDYQKARLDGLMDRVIIERGEAQYFHVLHRLLNKYRPKYIFHLAALPLAKPDNISTEEAMAGTVMATAHFLELIGTMKAQDGYEPERFVYASSSMVYGDFRYEPADEEHPTNPKEIYGTTKLAGEVMTRGLSKLFDLKSAIIRPSAVYGMTDMNRRVTQIFVEKALHGQKLTIMGEDESLDFTNVRDTANGFILAALRPEAIGETFNITYGSAHRLYDYAMEIKKHCPNLEVEIVPRDAFRPKRGTLSIEKARKLLGYEPKVTLGQGVQEYVEFARTRLFKNS